MALEFLSNLSKNLASSMYTIAEAVWSRNYWRILMVFRIFLEHVPEKSDGLGILQKLINNSFFVCSNEILQKFE